MTKNEKELHLIPVSGEGAPLDAFCAPLITPRPKRRLARALGVLLCTLSSMFFITVVFLLALSAAHRAQEHAVFLRLAESAFSGGAAFSVSEKEKDKPLFPEAAETAPESAESPLPPPASETQPAETDRYPIAPADLSTDDVHALFNETDYEPDTAALLAAPLPFPDFASWAAEYGAGEPYILILHTHGTESYAPEGSDTYKTTDSFRSHDRTENVVAVGDAMTETFEAAGIPVLHCTEMFDAESYQSSYSRASAAIRQILAEHPSIQIVLDVHRDSIIRADLTRLRPVTEADGAPCAQFMIVAGTDFKGADFPNWRDNLSFALKIQNTLLSRTDRFVRAINLRGAGFNEHYRAGSLLLEVGSCGNTLAEAKRAGVTAAIAIADVVTGGGCIVEVSDILP